MYPRVVSWFSLTASVAAAVSALFIVIPAPNRLLLPLAVGAPELSVWIVLCGLLGALLPVRRVRSSHLAKVALVLGGTAACVALSPLARFPRVAAHARAELRALSGGDSPASNMSGGSGARPAPIVWRELLTGFRASHAVREHAVREHAVPFASRGGELLTMEVYRPPGTAPSSGWPVLVQIYGGAWQRGDPADFAEFASYFAARGWVVFAIDYRHAPAHRFPAQLDDVSAALDWIRMHGGRYRADSARIVLLGRSAGAHLAMLAAYGPTATPVRGVVSYYGPVDLVEGYRSPPSPDPLKVRDVEIAFLGGTPAEVPARYREASPITYAGRRQPPTLLLYGGRDHVVEPRFGRQLRDSLRAHGTPVVHVEIPWAEHAFDAVPHGPSGQLSRWLTERFARWAVSRA